MGKQSAKQTLIVALVLCLGCSILVSTAAVGLKPMQEANRLLDRNRNILAAAGLSAPGQSRAEVARLFGEFEVRLVNLETGRYATDDELKTSGIDPRSYDQRKAARDPALSVSMKGDDPAGIQRKPRYATVYVLPGEKGLRQIVLPVHGAGLWGTLYGFLVLEGDLTTVRGLSFYEHKETPGLGAKVGEPEWKALWPGKQAYDAQGQVAIKVVKGSASREGEIDGLSGATLTTRGVNNLIRFWLGERGFAPFLKNLKAGEA
ncbi:MAG: Na(+)-translocating NADH-quinone reductase subunit C [Burkholderiaceae bacterium]